VRVIDVAIVVVFVLAVLWLLNRSGWLSRVYFYRVPLLIAAGVMAFGILAFDASSPAGALLHNAFDVDADGGIVWVSFLAFTAFAAMEMSWRLVRIHGHERFFAEKARPSNRLTAGSSREPEDSGETGHGRESEGDEEREEGRGHGNPDVTPDIRAHGGGTSAQGTQGGTDWPKVANVIFGVVVFVAMFVLVCLAMHVSAVDDCASESDDTNNCPSPLESWSYGEAVLGLFLFFAFIIAATIVQLWFTSPSSNIKGSTLFYLADWKPFRGYSEMLRAQDPHFKLRNAVWSRIKDHTGVVRLRRLLRRFPPELGLGYIAYGDDNKARHVLSGHVASLALLALTFLAYKYLGDRGFGYVQQGSPTDVPTLGYVLLLFTATCWLLSALAFFFDRYRVPVLLPLLLLLVATSRWWGTTPDYFFETGEYVREQDEVAKEDPEEGTLVVVAANGGGIQAAAWTARVLMGLQNECPKGECGPGFAESLRLVCSVSGGSVGTLYYVNEYSDTDRRRRRGWRRSSTRRRHRASARHPGSCSIQTSCAPSSPVTSRSGTVGGRWRPPGRIGTRRTALASTTSRRSAPVWTGYSTNGATNAAPAAGPT
jgi:hypothetical protein